MNKDTILNGLIIILALILAIILAFNYADPSDKYIPEISENNKSGHMADMKSNRSDISLEPINMSLATVEDKKLIDIIKESDNILRNDLISVSDAAKNNDRKSVGMYGIIIRQDSQKYLNVSNNINVSAPFKILLDEYRYALENYSVAGKHIESGSINLRDLEVSINYINKGPMHMDNIYNLIGIDI